MPATDLLAATRTRCRASFTASVEYASAAAGIKSTASVAAESRPANGNKIIVVSFVPIVGHHTVVGRRLNCRATKSGKTQSLPAHEKYLMKCPSPVQMNTIRLRSTALSISGVGHGVFFKRFSPNSLPGFCRRCSGPCCLYPKLRGARRRYSVRRKHRRRGNCGLYPRNRRRQLTRPAVGGTLSEPRRSLFLSLRYWR